jgi:hypothetical protein
MSPGRKPAASPLGELLDLSRVGLDIRGEQVGLEARAVHHTNAHWLNDEVQMSGTMRPETRVDLLWQTECGDTRTRPPEQRAKFVSLLGRKVGEMYDMSGRLKNQRSDTERTHAMLYPPPRGRVDETSRKWSPTLGEVTSDAANSAHRADRRDDARAPAAPGQRVGLTPERLTLASGLF